MSKFQKNAYIVAIILAIIPCFMWTAQNKIVPDRYIIYSIVLFHSILAMLIYKTKYKNFIYIFMVLLSVFYNHPSEINRKSFQSLVRPVYSVEKIFERIQVPMVAGEQFSFNATVLADSGYVAYMALKSPLVVALPDYVQFRKQKGNELIDGIIIHRKHKDWDNTKMVFVDDYGVTFTRITPEDNDRSVLPAFYKRTSPIKSKNM
jgi:hypothetical protein